MKYVKIKVKTLLIIIALLMTLSLCTYFLRDNIIYTIGQFYDKGDKEEIAGAYYNRVAENFPHKKSAINAANKQIFNILDKNNFKIIDRLFFFPRSTMKTGLNVGYNSIMNINNDYNEIIKHHINSDQIAEYTIGVSLMNWLAGEKDRAISLLNNIDYIEDEELEEIRKLNLSAMYMTVGKLEESRLLIENDINKCDKYKYLRKDLIAYSSFMLKDYESFRNNLVENTIRYQNFKDLNHPYIKPLKSIKEIIENYNQLLEAQQTRKKTSNTLEGKVTISGKPLPYTLVFVKDNKNRGFSSHLDEGLGVMSIGITNEEGIFKLENIPNGTYGLGIGVDWQRVNGMNIDMRSNYDIKFAGNDKKFEDINFNGPLKVTKAEKLDGNKMKFEWESNIDDIAYYVLQFGEVRLTEDKKEIVTFSYFKEDEIKENSIIIDLDNERNNSICAGASWGWDGLDPYYVVEPLYHRGNYAYKIVGYSKDGNIITDNLGSYTNKTYDTIYIEGKEWTNADKLLLDRKYEEATIEYEKAIEIDPNDLHSMKALTKLYYYGGEYDKKSDKLIGKDWDKAQKYLEILNSKLKYNSSIRFKLADIYKFKDDLQKSLEFHKSLLDGKHYYHYKSIGDLYVYMGDFQNAEESYLKYLDKTKYDSTVADLLMIYILQNRLELLQDISKRYNNESYYAEYEKYTKLYKDNIDRIGYDEFYALINSGEIEAAEEFLSRKDDSLSKFYKGILILKKNIEREDKENKYTEMYEKQKNSTLKYLMKCFGKANLNTGFGDY